MIRTFTDIQKRIKTLAALLTLLLSVLTLGAETVSAQSLNWEGPTGVFVTPLAYTAPSPKNNIGKPVIAFHFWDAGEVIGNFETASVTVGLLGRTEFGYTRSFHQSGNTPGLSPLWSGGFNIVHGKVNLVPENAGKHKWVPAISAGFVSRTQDAHVSGMLVTPIRSYNNNDFYLVATKTITQIKGLPIILSAGYKATNGVFLGLAGNAPTYKGCAFGVAAFVIKGPAKSTIILGGEFLQQSREVRNLPGADIPTTLVYAMRVVPSEKIKLNLDFGVAQAGGKIMPGVDLKARHTPGAGISYSF
jgi:hypothetical protein